MSSREQKKEVARDFIRKFVQENRQRSLYLGGSDFLDRDLFPEKGQPIDHLYQRFKESQVK